MTVNKLTRFVLIRVYIVGMVQGIIEKTVQGVDKRQESVFLTTFETRCTNERCSTLEGVSKNVHKTCPIGWKSRKESCYKIFLDKANWFQAQMNCRKRGSTLVIIEDASENQWLKNQYSNFKTRIWIDAVDLAKVGEWYWFSSGKAARYLNWLSGEPNNRLSNEHCTMMFHKHHSDKWNDGNCATGLGFVCEMKLD